MEEGQRWRDGALAMLRPMTGGVVESSGGREVKRERERLLGPEQRRVEANQTEPRYKRNEQREKKSETRGRQSAAEPHWRSHALPRDPRRFSRSSCVDRSRGGPRSGSNFFDPKRVTLERETNEVVFHTVLIVLIRGEASLIATLLYLLRERSVYAQPFKLTRSTVTRESSR